MKIMCCEVGGYRCDTEHARTWVPDRQGCIADGFTEDEIATAEANRGIWIDCSREEEPDDPHVDALVNICAGVAQVATETLQEKLDAVTAQRDTLLAALKEIEDGPTDEPQVENTGEWQTGVYCGLEDRDIRDRYQACDYGFEKGAERAIEWAQNVVAAAIAKAEPKTVTPPDPGAHAG